MPAPDTSDSGLLSPVWAGTPVHAATSDRAWLQAMLDVEAALARAQARLGLIPLAAAEAITAAATADSYDLAALAARARETANPVVAVVRQLTAAVATTTGNGREAADHVHHGATSQDILDTATMLVATRALRLVLTDLDRTAAALARLAREHRDTPMAGRTLTQHAVPTTFGLKAAGWLLAVTDAAADLRQLADGGLPAQLGGAAGTLAAYLERPPGAEPPPVHTADQLLAGFAAELGLREPVLPWHTNRTPVVRLGAALTVTTGALGKLAVDVLTLASTEVAEVAEPAATGRGASSAMPHKQNPVLATMIRATALQLPSLAATLGHCMLAEDERPAGAWQAEWQPLRESLRLTGGAAHTAADLTTGLRVFPDRMRANLDLTGGQVVSERLSLALTPVLGKAAAKALLTNASAQAARTGHLLRDILATDLAEHLPPDELQRSLDPTTYTGAATHLTDRALDHYQDRQAKL